MSLHFTMPPLAAVTLTPEQAAILDLLDRVEALEKLVAELRAKPIAEVEGWQE